MAVNEALEGQLSGVSFKALPVLENEIWISSIFWRRSRSHRKSRKKAPILRRVVSGKKPLRPTSFCLDFRQIISLLDWKTHKLTTNQEIFCSSGDRNFFLDVLGNRTNFVIISSCDLNRKLLYLVFKDSSRNLKFWKPLGKRPTFSFHEICKELSLLLTSLIFRFWLCFWILTCFSKRYDSS